MYLRRELVVSEDAHPQLFICYRRNDSDLQARWIAESLRHAFGSKSVFIDIESTQVGDNWPQRLEAGLEGASALIVVIGPAWLGSLDQDYKRRLDDESDWVRREIAYCLGKKLVIPVLVHDAELPRRQALPEDIRDLRNCQAYRIRDATFERDIEDFIEQLLKAGFSRSEVQAGEGRGAVRAEQDKRELLDELIQELERSGFRRFQDKELERADFRGIQGSQSNVASAALARVREESRELLGAVKVCLDAADRRGETDLWARISAADLACLTSDHPARVATIYGRALADAPPFAAAAVRRQLELYASLGVLGENVAAALAVVDKCLPAPEPDPVPNRLLLFSGHRVDAPGRATPRFPPSAEEATRAMIREAVETELAVGSVARVEGIAGGASGGDILFHEVCEELGVATTLYLAVPRELYVVTAVQDAGPEWVARFDHLHAKLPTRVLADSLELPRWARDASTAGDYSIWERNNRWTLHNALAHGATNVILIALWDGEGGDGPGGTADMVRTASERGARTVILDAKRLLE